MAGEHQREAGRLCHSSPLGHGDEGSADGEQCVYHIYNRGNNGENLFREERNYRYFLQLYAKHVTPVVDTFAYCQGFNKTYGRTGSLFENSFKRTIVNSERYFTALLFYIHFNPQKHGFVTDFRDWPWSSYSTLLSSQPTKLLRAEVMRWFGNATGFNAFHQGVVNQKAIQSLIADDFE